MNHRKVLGEQRVARHHGHDCLVRPGQFSHRLLQRVRSHIVGRRVDQVTRQKDADDDSLDRACVRPVRQRETHGLAGLLSVPGEDIAAEHQAERRQLRRGGRLGEMPVAFRQRPGEIARQQRSLLAVTQPEKGAADAAA